MPSPPAITGVVPTDLGIVYSTVSWLPPPAPDLPITGYTVTMQPGNQTISVGAATPRASFSGLDRHTRYTYAVTATNLAGGSAPARFGPDLPVRPSRVDVNAAGAGQDTYKFLAATSEDGRYAAMSVKTNSVLVPAEHRTTADEGYFHRRRLAGKRIHPRHGLRRPDRRDNPTPVPGRRTCPVLARTERRRPGGDNLADLPINDLLRRVPHLRGEPPRTNGPSNQLTDRGGSTPPERGRTLSVGQASAPQPGHG